MRYTELHCKSNFSFLEGASAADELVSQAQAIGLHALAVTDRNSLAGIVRAHVAAKSTNLKLIVGAEIAPVDSPSLCLYPTNRKAYGRLSSLITLGRRRAQKGECQIFGKDVPQYAEGNYAVWIPPRDSNAFNAWLVRDPGETKDVFGDRLFVAIELHLDQSDDRRRVKLIEYSNRHGIPLVAANDVHYHIQDRRHLQDVLVCIREGCTLDTAGKRLFSNGERYLKPASDLAKVLGPGCEEWLERTSIIADACTFSLDELRYDYPEELVPAGQTPTEYLRQLTWDGARNRWPSGMGEKVKAQIEHELKLIAELRYEPFFLTVYDVVAFARSKEILCQGRGSAANSAVCYCLGITSVDPVRGSMLFERFISKERNEAPDIDVDFEHERREEVMQYIYSKYGRERAGIVAVVNCFRPKSAARDVGKVLGFSQDLIDRLAEAVDAYDHPKDLNRRISEAGLGANQRTLALFKYLVSNIMGFPRHLSQHVGGFVITNRPLHELVPIENATMPGRTVIEWDKDDIEALGILKVDCLALGMLTAIQKCFKLVEDVHKRPLTLATIPAEDKNVYDMCCTADTIGVFQIESRAQMTMLPRLKPRNFYDLVIEVSLVRPGPIQGGMIHPYLRRRDGLEPVTYENEALREVLENTLGIPIFQEQVMRLAIVAAGYSAGEADLLRRSMAAWQKTGMMELQEERFVSGMLKNGYSRKFADALFSQIKGFGEYGFPESHAASFALLVYASAWLKCYYPGAFLTALLNSQPMGFYAPAQLIKCAQNHGVTVLPVDVNYSAWDSTLIDGNAVRLGFRQVKGLSKEQHVAPLIAARETLFTSLDDLARRSKLRAGALGILARADAFASLKMERRDSLWEVLAQHEQLPLFEGLDVQESKPILPTMPLSEQVAEDYRKTGLSLKAHPISFVRSELTQLGVVTAKELKILKPDRFVRVAGTVLVRQRPGTASGVVFITLEDETGLSNAIVWPAIYNHYRQAVRSAAGLIVEGRLQREGDVISVIAKRVRDLRELVPSLSAHSRDFR